MKLLIDLDDDYEKIGCEMPSGTPVGKCRLHSDAFPPAAEKIEFGITSMRHQLPAIVEVTGIPDALRGNPQAIIQQLVSAPVSIHGGNHSIKYTKLTSGRVVCKNPKAMTNQQRFEVLKNRYHLTAKDISRMTYRQSSSIYGWTASRQRPNGKRDQIPPAPLELLRYKMGDKELIHHCAVWRVAPEDRLTRHAVMWNGAKTGFWDLPANEQFRQIVKEYNLSDREVATMTLEKPTVYHQWKAASDKGGYREMPKAELELLLLKLDEKKLKLDESVPPALRKRFAEAGVTR